MSSGRITWNPWYSFMTFHLITVIMDICNFCCTSIFPHMEKVYAICQRGTIVNFQRCLNIRCYSILIINFRQFASCLLFLYKNVTSSLTLSRDVLLVFHISGNNNNHHHHNKCYKQWLLDYTKFPLNGGH